MKQRWITTGLPVALSSAPGWARSGNGLLRFKVNPAQTKATVAVADLSRGR